MPEFLLKMGQVNLKGNSRGVLPVKAAMALAKAGANGGVRKSLAGTPHWAAAAETNMARVRVFCWS